MSQRVEARDGTSIAVHDLGGDGPDVLLAHATGFHAMVWEPVAAILRPHLRCVAFDCRGHGDSDPSPDGTYDWNRFADNALDVVAALGLERPAAAGHSCGGALLLLAEQAQPGTFRSLWCYEPIVYPGVEPPPPSHDNPLSAGALRRRHVFESRQAAYDTYASKPPFSVLEPAALRAYVDHGFRDRDDGQVELKCRGEDEAEVYAGGMAHAAFAHMAEVACPTTFACGEHTDAIGPALLEMLAAPLPDGRTEVLPGLGHFGPLQDPAAVAASILRALA